MEESVTAYGAAPSLLGYIYQVRLALLWAVRESKVADFCISLETLDDVAFHLDGEASKVLQTKHSLNSKANLSDLSPEVWKTLRVWMTGLASGELPSNLKKFLVSTSAATAGTACGLLCIGPGRDVKAAADRLKHAAISSTNAELKPIFDAFLALDDQGRAQLLEQIFVIPSQPDVGSLDSALSTELYYVSLEHKSLAIQLLEGWWYQRVIYELLHPGVGIARAEIDSQIVEIQTSLRPESLPIDGALDQLLVALESLPEFASRPFYKQVELVGGSAERIRNAITSYLQAFRQRSSWIRHDLVFDADLKQYDQRLVAEWTLLRAQVCDELGDKPGEAEMLKAGRAILKWVEDAPIPIKPGVNIPWVCRGSLHMLAEDLRVGWHPDFLTRMHAALGIAP
jgi:hypothetical protein